MMLNRKGQESAPFELLIAVIIMGFVIFVGMNAMKELSLQKCKGETESKLESLKTALQIVVTQKSPQSISYNTSSCFNPDKEITKLVEKTDPLVCANYCGVAKNVCTILQYSYTGEGSFSMMKCKLSFLNQPFNFSEDCFYYRDCYGVSK